MRSHVRLGSIAVVAALTALVAPLRAADPINPILFVTQVPMPDEINSRNVAQSYMSCVSPFANHLGDTAHAGRGGSLWVRFGPNPTPALNHQVIDLLAVADWSTIPGGKPATNKVAVRNPSVYWDASKAIFSMVIGAPIDGSDTTTFLWQLYEITLPTQAQLNANVKPVVTRLSTQPACNNIMPCYAPGGKILFASDRPYNGQDHLTQREEYLGLPTVSGLWSMDPNAASSIHLLHHSPSGAFSPTVDSAGRVIFTNWDHLSRDPEAVTDSRPPITSAPYNENFVQTFNGAGNFATEASGATFTQVTAMPPNSWDIFPEPRNFDHKSLIDDFGNNLNGNSFNVFLPWMINLDGTTGEILNHVGRHEVSSTSAKNFKNDANLVDLNPAIAPGYGGMGVRNFFFNLMWTREDPLHAGTFYGSDAADLGSHGAGQIVSLNGGPAVNPDAMLVTYVTPGITAKKPAVLPNAALGQSPLVNPEHLYRTPVPLADGALIASHVAVTQVNYNTGTVTNPAAVAGYNFRLRSLKSGTNNVGDQGMVPDIALTSGIPITTSYYVAGQPQPVSFNAVTAWELDPAEVISRPVPTSGSASIDPIEAAQFTAANVHLPTFQNWLIANNAALSVSRDVTKRDRHDRQQPFNLKVTWSGKQTTGTSGTIYNIAWVQFLQADLRRGYLLGGATPAPGRRIVATPLHDMMSENVNTAGAPAGSLKLGDDGSFAAIVPAGKALTWQLLDNNASFTSQVKERFWVTFQKGEIRTCANCHGINTADQAGATKPTNPPQALLSLLTQWKTNHPSGAMQLATNSASIQKNGGAVSAMVNRVNGTTGPVSVDYATSDGTAHAGTDYTSASGTLSWADGDTAPKAINISLLNNPTIAASKAFTVTLSNPTYGTVGTISSQTVTLTETPFDTWRFTYFGANANTPGMGQSGDDPDGDGQNNASEFGAGTIPNVPTSVLRADISIVSNHAHIAFTAQPGIAYVVEYSDNLSPPDWHKLTDVPAVGTTQPVDITDPSNQTQRFYRVSTNP